MTEGRREYTLTTRCPVRASIGRSDAVPFDADPRAGSISPGGGDELSLRRWPAELVSQFGLGEAASAARAQEGGRFKVESEDTTYEADGIRSRFVDRGAEVIREL